MTLSYLFVANIHLIFQNFLLISSFGTPSLDNAFLYGISTMDEVIIKRKLLFFLSLHYTVKYIWSPKHKAEHRFLKPCFAFNRNICKTGKARSLRVNGALINGGFKARLF